MMPQPSATSTTTFVFSLPSRLSNSRLRLEPFALSTHAAAFVNGTKHHPDLFQYRSHGPWETVVEFEAFYNARVADNATDTCFAVLVQEERRGDGGGVEEEEEEGCGEDRRVGGVFAGVIGLENASVRDCSVEIGFVCSLPYPFFAFLVVGRWLYDSGGCSITEWGHHHQNNSITILQHG